MRCSMMVVEDHPARGYPAAEITESLAHVDLACLGERAQELVGPERPQGTQTQAVEAGTDDRPSCRRRRRWGAVLPPVQREVRTWRAPGESARCRSPGRGIIDTMAVTRSRPSPVTRVATVWSRRELSDRPGGRTMLLALCGGGGHLGDAVLVGVEPPLWARNRNGCAIVGWIGIRGEPGVEEERAPRDRGRSVGEVADHPGRGEPPLSTWVRADSDKRIQTGQGRWWCNRSP